MTTIIPRFKLILMYDILPDKQSHYFRYVQGEFVPSLRSLGLYMISAWHIAYGDYPSRQIEFAAESFEVIQTAFDNPRWARLESRLQSYTTEYSRKIIAFEDRFQF